MGEPEAAAVAQTRREGNRRTGKQCERHEQKSAKRDVGIGVVHAVEEGVVIEEALKAVHVDVQGKHGQKARGGKAEPAPGTGGVEVTALVEGAGACRDREKEDGRNATEKRKGE